MNDKSSKKCLKCNSEMVPVKKRKVSVGGVLGALFFVLGIPALFYNPLFGMVMIIIGILISIAARPGTLMKCPDCGNKVLFRK